MRQTVQELGQRGYQVETFLSATAGEARRRAQFLEPEVETLVVVGGDGTVNEVLNGLGDPSRISLAVLPAGTANVLARELSLPEKPDQLVLSIEKGCWRRLDMGIQGDRRFLLFLSAGFDATVAEEVRRRRGSSLGYPGYTFPIVRALRRYRQPRMTIWVDEQKIAEGGYVLVSNTRNYGGIFTFAYAARCDSGWFDVCIFPRCTKLALGRYYLAAFRGRIWKEGEMLYLTGKRVRIESEEPVAVQVDGDYSGTTPVDLHIVPASVSIVVPSGATASRWQARP